METGLGFTCTELTLNYTDFTRMAKERRAQLAPDVLEWLNKWEMWDLACSPMNDEHRSQIRYGHYLGWFHCTEKKTPNA